jgi:hypothetical protein
MLDEQGLRRLAEMGIDVYAPRMARPAVAQTADAEFSSAIAAPASRTGSRVSVLILADGGSRWSTGVVPGVERMLKFARVAHATTDRPVESELAGAAAAVVFGDALARKAGSMVSAERQPEMAWVFAADAATVARDATAKRALWSELKRLLRMLNGANLPR